MLFVKSGHIHMNVCGEKVIMDYKSRKQMKNVEQRDVEEPNLGQETQHMCQRVNRLIKVR